MCLPTQFGVWLTEPALMCVFSLATCCIRQPGLCPLLAPAAAVEQTSVCMGFGHKNWQRRGDGIIRYTYHAWYTCSYHNLGLDPKSAMHTPTHRVAGVYAAAPHLGWSNRLTTNLLSDLISGWLVEAQLGHSGLCGRWMHVAVVLLPVDVSTVIESVTREGVAFSGSVPGWQTNQGLLVP